MFHFPIRSQGVMTFLHWFPSAKSTNYQMLMGSWKDETRSDIPLQPVDEEIDMSGPPAPKSRCTSVLKWISWMILILLVSMVLLTSGGGGVRGLLHRMSHRKGIDFKKEISTSCVNPPIRREWRSLAAGEKLHYLESVQCLRQLPSRLVPGLAVYDDFPHIHEVHGMYGMKATLQCSTGVKKSQFFYSS